jgi:hypothetical protein
VHIWSRDGVVSTATGCGLQGPDISYPKVRSPVKWVLGSFPGVKSPGLEADHSFPSRAEVKSEGICIRLLILYPFMTSTGPVRPFLPSPAFFPEGTTAGA